MKRPTKLILLLAGLCLSGLIATAAVTAMQISLDAPASLPSDI